MKTLGLLFCSLLIIISCASTDNNQQEWSLKDGYVPDSVTAVKVAKVILVRIYGKKVLDRRPFKAVLKDNIWIIEGTLKTRLDGGVPHIEIQKSDGKVVKMYHSK